MPVHTGRLLLGTQDPFLLPESSLLVTTLSEAGLLGAVLAGREGAFAVGGQFLQLISFAGCSVRIELSPAGDTPFCHVRIMGPFERPLFLSGRNTRPPRCPRCRSPLTGWREALAAWDGSGGFRIPCPSCGAASPPWAYDWREKAGFGRLFIGIEEVFPGEGVPTPRLMNLLEDATGSPWRHFSIQDEENTP